MRGFGKPKKPKASSGMTAEAIVSAQDGEPKVVIRWENLSGWLTPQEARQHALTVLHAAAVAESDAAVIRWSHECVGLSPEEAIVMRRLIKLKRAAEEQPSCSLDFGSYKLSPDETRKQAMQLLFAAYNTEQEAFFCKFLVDACGLDGDRLADILDSLRASRNLPRWDEMPEQA